jgi:CBS domain containing-hemolysin-like protein
VRRKRLRSQLPEGEYATLARFLLDNFGKIPKESEQISFGQYLIAAHKLQRHRIVQVKIKAAPDTKK